MRLLVLVLGLVSGTGASADRQELRLLLEVVVNGRPTGQIADFVARGDKLYATRHDLHQLGFAAAGDDDRLISLSELSGVTYRLDAATQTLVMTATDAALVPNAVAVQEAAKLTPVRSGLGAVLNYDVTETYAGARNAARGLFDGRVFTPYGILSSQYLAAAGVGAGGVRLDTAYSFSDPDALRRYRAGDLINGGLIWTRPVRIGGVQVDTNFGLRPDLVTFPTPQISGTAAVPSTVDVLVNNVRQLSRNVDPGPFAVTQLPVVNGAGSVTVVVQDALGQQTVQTLPFYSATSLLAPGLVAYSAELGSVRNNYALRSDDYSTPVASGSVRYGLFRFMTVEGHAEGTSSLGMAGGGVSVNVGNLAVLSVAGAGSVIGGRSGTLLSATFERVTPLFSMSASIQQASPGYRDVAAVKGDPVPRQEVRASFGVSLGRFGSLGVAYTGLNQQASLSTTANPLLDPIGAGFEASEAPPANTSRSSRTTLLTMTYSTQVYKNLYGYVDAFHDFSRGAGSGLVVGVSLPIGDRRSLSGTVGSAAHQTYVSEQATQATLNPGDFGGTVLNQNGQPARQLAEGEYYADYARLTAGADRLGGHTALRTGAAGSLVLADRHVFAGNTIQDSFAVVDTGVGGIGVVQENRPAGVTDASGHLLLSNLQSFADNRIGIDPAAVPVDADLASASEVVRPQDRSGVVIKFALQANAGATMHLVDGSGAFLPVGSTAVLQPGGAPNVVGYDGVAFIRHLEEHNVLIVTRPNGKTCRVAFDFKPHPGSQPDLGRLPCR